MLKGVPQGPAGWRGVGWMGREQIPLRGKVKLSPGSTGLQGQRDHTGSPSCCTVLQHPKGLSRTKPSLVFWPPWSWQGWSLPSLPGAPFPLPLPFSSAHLLPRAPSGLRDAWWTGSPLPPQGSSAQSSPEKTGLLGFKGGPRTKNRSLSFSV